MSDLVIDLCKKVGTKQVFTAPYAPQNYGMVERFHATLCRDLEKFVIIETNWDKNLSFATFRYNNSVNYAASMTPYQALFLFGSDAFEFDALVGLQVRLNEEPVDVPERLKELHRELLTKVRASRRKAQIQYEKCVHETAYEVGDQVLIYHVPWETQQGRKLRVPWIGPYRITEKLSTVGYSATSELE